MVALQHHVTRMDVMELERHKSPDGLLSLIAVRTLICQPA